MQFSIKYLLCVFVFSSITSTGFGIKCFSCRSDYDPRCVDPFDNSTIAITDCAMVKTPSGLPSVMCQKIRQKVNGEWRNYARDCAPADESPQGIQRSERECYQKTGADNILTEYCTCYDKDGCNSSFTFKPISSLLLALMVFPALVGKMLS